MKSLIIKIAIGVLVVGGSTFAVYKINSNSDSKDLKSLIKNSQTNTGEGDQKNNGSYFETMTDLMARGKSMKCTYTQKVDNENTADGVVYMADKKARVEIIANKGTDHEGKMYSITDHEWSYSWTEGSSKGFKMTLKASELDKKQRESVSDMAKEIDFKCSSWKKDNSKFKAPSNIEFEDMSAMMEDLGDINFAEEAAKAETQGNEFICNLCKNAPASEMEECLGGVVCD